MSAHILKVLVLVPSCMHPLHFSIAWHHVFLLDLDSGFLPWLNVLLYDILVICEFALKAGQWSVGAPALRLLMSSRSDRVRSVSMEGKDVASLFVHWGSLLLCAASAPPGSLSLSEQTPSSSSVCQVLLCSETFAVNCLCFLSFTSPNMTDFLYNILISVSLFITPSLCSFPFHLYLFILSFLLLLLSTTCISLTPPSSPPAFAVLWRPTEAIRTDGLRWFPGSTHFYWKQPGTAAGMMLSQGVRRSNYILIQFSLPNSKP